MKNWILFFFLCSAILWGHWVPRDLRGPEDRVPLAEQGQAPSLRGLVRKQLLSASQDQDKESQVILQRREQLRARYASDSKVRLQELLDEKKHT